MIKVKYLASIAEKLGKEDDSLAWQAGLTPLAVWQTLNPDNAMPTNTICAVDFEFFDKTAELSGDCELAFFPPVTGGW